MKKILLLLSWLPKLCLSQITTTVDFQNGPWHSYANCAAESYCGSIGALGYNANTIISVTNVMVKVTHGCAIFGHVECCPMIAVQELFLASGGVVIEYNFKANCSYQISIHGYMGSGSLQMEMTNNPIYFDPCDHHNVDLSGTSNPFASFTSLNASIQLTPDQCYSYLWFSAQGYTTLYSVTIEETPMSILGDVEVCATSNPYSINGLPSGATVVWTITPSSGIANLSQSNNQAVLTKVAAGFITLSAEINQQSCNIISKTVIVGNPITAWPYVRYPDPNCLEKNRQVLYGANVYPEGSQLLWGYVEGPNTSPVVFLPQNGIDQMNITVPNYNQYNAIYVVGVNSCGTGIPAIQIFEFQDDCGDNQDWRHRKEPNPITELLNKKLSLSPNPAVNNITVKIPPEYLINSTLKIIDVSGRTIKLIAAIQTTQTINISSLKNGVYILQLTGKAGSQIIKLVKQ